MALRKSMSSDNCPVARSVDVIGDRWSILIVRDAFDGLRRFGEFQNSLGVAKNILSDRLRRLVDSGILSLQDASDGTTFREYVLTQKGENLFPVVLALRQWGENHLFKEGEHHSILIDQASEQQIPYMAPADMNGNLLHARQTIVAK
jgi:DNA-binding HxlR family transcriptional regulator